jgi:hypothetical protein
MNRYSYAFLIVVSASCLLWFPRLHAANGEDVAPEATITCSVLEAHMNPDLGISAAVFHQRNKDEAARFSVLLKEHTDASVEFQTNDGAWHKGWVARLKSSFGRGLLLFASSSAQLKEKDIFVLKFE